MRCHTGDYAVRRATILVAILAFVPLAGATAQARPGERVRVTHQPICPAGTICLGPSPRQRSVGTFLAWEADSLIMESNGNALALPLNSVTKLEVGRGQKSYTVEGAIIGLLGGGVLGVLAEISAGHETGEKGKKICKLFIGDIIVETGRPSEISCREEPGTPETWGSPSWRGATIGAVLGAIAGGLIGARSMSDRWQKIPLEQVRVRVTKRRDGRFGLGASVRF